MDISDGLALDLHRLCRASGVAATLESIPLLKGATIEQALHDGEDYELLYTAPPGMRVPGMRIGTIVTGNAGAITLEGKRIPNVGYDHVLKRR
jgi:thiamine-monophosphate kinase